MNAEAKHYAQAWYEALQSASAKQKDEVSQNMLNLLQVQGKLSWLSSIVGSVQDLEDSQQGVLEVTVKTAYKIPQKEVEEIVKKLVGVKNIRASVEPKRGLLGGIVVQTKSRRWDISLKNQVEQLKRQLS